MQSLCTALKEVQEIQETLVCNAQTSTRLQLLSDVGEGFPKTTLKQWDKRQSQQMLSLSDLSPRSVATPDQSQAKTEAKR